MPTTFVCATTDCVDLNDATPGESTTAFQSIPVPPRKVLYRRDSARQTAELFFCGCRRTPPPFTHLLDLNDIALFKALVREQSLELLHQLICPLRLQSLHSGLQRFNQGIDHRIATNPALHADVDHFVEATLLQGTVEACVVLQCLCALKPQQF